MGFFFFPVLFVCYVNFSKFGLPVIEWQYLFSMTILQTSEYGLSNACFVFPFFFYSSHEDFVDLMFS